MSYNRCVRLTARPSVPVDASKVSALPNRSTDSTLHSLIHRGGFTAGSSSSAGGLDAMERDNDRNIDYMGDRVSALKKITVDIHDEVEGHHRLIDSTGDSMAGAQAALRETAAALREVVENARRHRYFWQMIGFCLVSFFFLRWIVWG